ncbi:hypothetical protein EGW08_016551 [Elysia chlorotica]|uniref:Protein kinase domain-containing protein n=1 Tax=Elysia chlorotica TaxID=188477 RepID=A0A433T2A2_ELYCH|nr:hypothetical protein EGW08_016551 [Elysia chlorotica]
MLPSIMADNNQNTSKEPKPSPKENYNPLEDEQFTEKYLGQETNEEDCQYDFDLDNNSAAEKSDSEEENDAKNFGMQLSCTPPQPRARKQKKDRTNMKGRYTDKSYKELLINKRQQQPKTAVNIIKNEYLSDPALCNLSECDSDDNLDWNAIREKKEKKRRESRESKKTLSKLRLSDRQEKRFSSEFSLMAVSDGIDSAPLTGMKLDGSGRFAHLKPKSMMPLSPECLAKRQVIDPPICPKDREDFYSKFSVLINLGTEAKKDKEKKMSSNKRQISIEQEQWRSHVIEQIWIELQAYINADVSPEEQLQNLNRERQKSEQVIDDINNFSFADSALDDTHDVSHANESSGSHLLDKSNTPAKGDFYREMVSRSVSASFSDVNLTDETVCLQGKALIQVRELLERLDHYESCYRSTASCEAHNEKYKDPVFQRRVKCLNLWFNITCDLCQKLKLFGRTIGAYSRNVQWPLVNFEFPNPQPREFLASPRASIPNVLETEPLESDNEEDGEEEKQEGGKTSSDVQKDVEAVNPAREKTLLSPQPKHVQFLCGGDSSGQTSPIGSPQAQSPVFANSCSTPLKPLGQATNNFLSGTSVLSLSRASSELSLDDSRSVKSSIYRHYVEKCLRKMGLQRLNLQLKKLFHRSLIRAKEALERPKDASYSDIEVSDPPSPADTSPRPSLARGSSLSEHGEWSSQFIEMGLPSFRPTYLFLVKIWMDVVHECLKLRRDQTPIGEPSFLSIRQLIRECKEVLKGACQVKQYYHFMVNAVMWDEEEAEAKFETDLAEFDSDMRNMLDMYFNYLQSWIHQLQSLPEASLGMKSALEEEWIFTKGICSYVIGGEAEAGKKFSALASGLLSSISDFLDKGIDANTRTLYDEEVEDLGDDLESGNFNEEFEADENDNVAEINQYGPEMKKNVKKVLQNFKDLFNEARERASKALGFAKLLRKDLEIAADFNIAVTTKEIYSKLVETNHVQVQAPVSAGYVMFVPGHVISDTRLILQLLKVTSGREDPSGLVGRDDAGYLLMLRCEGGTDHLAECPIWQGKVVHVEPTADTAIALSHIEVMGLLFVVTHSSTLGQQRKHFENSMGRTVQLVNEQTSCHQSIAEPLAELKTNAMELMEKVAKAIKQVNENLNFNEVIQHEESILMLFRETMLKIYDFGFEYQRELMRLTSRDQRERQCNMTVSFAMDWMRFVTDRCERGKGMRPRWATQGLEFIALACEPKNIVYLSDTDFQDFQHRMLNCLTHIIGSSDNRTVGPGMSLSRSSLDLPRSGQHAMYRLVSCPESHQHQHRFTRSISGQSAQSEPIGHGHGHGHLSSSSSTPSTISSSFFGDNILNDGARGEQRSERMRSKIENLEKTREKMLQDNRVIGRITSRAQEPDLRMNVRRVKFRWQRGMKIGEGTFGKVYNAVNIDTGELMAMKEMKIQPNDQQSLKDLCDEIKNFEGINHKNLVKYFGVEVHRDEMLMFMEFCDTGSLEEVARAGLSEYIIRRYTHEIVQAVAHLHENNIVHRDIKGANIFLTSQGQVKLGDFGCSVKLKNPQTMPGENVNLVGSTAYMAPEVIKQEGYGRAADIWSLGCVVIEMATGKRPWHELEHNVQIMFRVGMGSIPPIPDSLCMEGKEFLGCCLVREISKRWTAQQLLDHIFVKYCDEVEEVEDKTDS